MWGTTRANWRSDIDYDGFDIDPNAHACGVETGLTSFAWYFGDGFQGCGQPLSAPSGSMAGLSYLLDSCDDASHPNVMHPFSGEFQPSCPCNLKCSDPHVRCCNLPDCTSCIEVEGHLARVDRGRMFDIYAPGNPIGGFDEYLKKAFPTQRLTLRDCASGGYPGPNGEECPVDRGTLTLRNGTSLGSLVSYTGSAPDLGAYEKGAPLWELGPRTDPPLKLMANRGSPTQMDLSWKDRVKNTSGYTVERRTNSETGFSRCDSASPFCVSVPPGQSTYTDATVVEGVDYTYRVRPSNETADWWYSNEAPTLSRCVGDCGSSGVVNISDLIIGVNIALGSLPVSACPAFGNAGGKVDIAQLIKAVNNALNGCASGS